MHSLVRKRGNIKTINCENERGEVMRKTEEILEFDKIKEKWAQLALTEQARQRIIDRKSVV